MRKILKRIYKMAKAEGGHRLKKIGDMLFGDIEREAGGFGNRGSNYKSEENRREEFKGNAGGRASTNAKGSYAGRPAGGIPRKVAEDLAIFNLRPPCTLEEVRKARNREIKKYHSDRFIDDPERYQTSKEIMQIYNAAYDRLKEYYKKS